MKIIESSIPQSLISLIQADFKVQWRQRKSPVMATLLAVVLLVTWKSFATMINGPQILLASCIAIVIMGMGLLGYPNLVARDREKGIFQRLRVTPAPTWTIMLSRILIQCLVISIMAGVVLSVAYFYNKIALDVKGYFLTVLATILCGTVFLGLGQTIVGFIKSSDLVNSTGRFIYFPLVFGGALAELGILGKITREIIDWSPYGTVLKVLTGAMNISAWNMNCSIALLVTILYAIFFAIIGIKWFKWTN